ncbi:molybdenum cofactor guanylyltransferase [Thermoanaerobacterium sp. DL9XJH110]|uniref:molybdenum cofactor guanylyltransferase n=1 Tax=Thermoanaerobacterium sp. DL9XJH110 TaxID=3386643 RepID=UPI003BB695A7
MRLNFDMCREKMACSAVVLCGGKSSRIGVKNKALLKIGGLTIIERIYSVLAPIFDEVFIVANSPAELLDLNPEFSIYTDETESRGPLSGIYTGLIKMKGEAGFFCACDMPFLNEELIKYLIKSSAGWDVTCPRKDNYVEPLHSVYRKTCIEQIKKLLNSPGAAKVQSLYRQVKTNFVDIKNLPCKTGPYDFFNVNTWEDYRKAIEIYELINDR